MQQYQIDGHTIALKLFNPTATNPPIVFIHGILSSLSMWEVVQLEWLQDKRWIALSLPGHYPAGFPRNFQPHALTPELIANLLWDALTQAVGDIPVIIGGLSTGGFASIAMAATKPERTLGLFVISGFVQGKWRGILGLLQTQARAGWLGKKLLMLTFGANKVSQPLFYNSLRFYAADAQAMYGHSQARELFGSAFAAFRRFDSNAMYIWFKRMPDVDITAWLAWIMAPTLVIHGERDPIVPYAQAEIIAQHVSQSQLVPVPEGGHVLMLECAEVYQSALEDWFRNVVG